MAHGDYVHGYGDRERARLQDQARTLEELLHANSAYLDGEAVLEAGCGVGAQTVPLARNSPGASSYRTLCWHTRRAHRLQQGPTLAPQGYVRGGAVPLVTAMGQRLRNAPRQATAVPSRAMVPGSGTVNADSTHAPGSFRVSP